MAAVRRIDSAYIFYVYVCVFQVVQMYYDCFERVSDTTPSESFDFSSQCKSTV